MSRKKMGGEEQPSGDAPVGPEAIAAMDPSLLFQMVEYLENAGTQKPLIEYNRQRAIGSVRDLLQAIDDVANRVRPTHLPREEKADDAKDV